MVLGQRAYHGEIGREATAERTSATLMSAAYHGEIGREATAVFGTAQPHEGARRDERRRAAPAAQQRAGTKIEVAGLAASAIVASAPIPPTSAWVCPVQREICCLAGKPLK